MDYINHSIFYSACMHGEMFLGHTDTVHILHLDTLLVFTQTAEAWDVPVQLWV